MAGFNKVILLGNLTRDPQLRYLQNNMAVCDFGLAVNRRYKDRDGNLKDDVCFVDLAAWGKGGETINQYCRKGSQLLVEGRLKLDQWTGQDGQKRSKLTVVVENFQFVGRREDSGPPGAAPQAAHGRAPQGVNSGVESAPPGPPDADYGPPGDEPPRPDDIPF